jgi:YaiO family outer membrane protein
MTTPTFSPRTHPTTRQGTAKSQITVHSFMACVLASLLPCAAAAQDMPPDAPSIQAMSPQDTTPATPLRNMAISLGGHQLSNGYGHWRDAKLSGVYGVGAHVWQAELAAKRQFGESGLFLGVSDTVTLSPDWYTSLSVGAGDGAFYLPRLRADAALYKKWLAAQNFVTSIGLGYYRAPDGHIDRALNLGAVWYFEQPWIVEAGVRMNRSNPGQIQTHQRFVALTYGHAQQDLFTLRYGSGGEGYQSIGAQAALVNFNSRQTGVSWKHWVTPQGGVQLSLERYRNPYYSRNGVAMAFFQDFN